MPSIILASSSIYRKQLLQRLTNKFKVITPHVNEKKLPNERGKDSALRLAILKAKTISKYLGSDYIVKSSVGHIRDLPKGKSKTPVQRNTIPKDLPED